MTTQEIKDLIASKIAGQGSAVDAGSALPEILNGIVDAIAAIPEVQTVYLQTKRSFDQLVAQGKMSVTSMASYMGVTSDKLRDLLDGKIPLFVSGSGYYNVISENTSNNDKRYIGFVGLIGLGAANPVVDPIGYRLAYDANDMIQFQEF